ncbi:MAG: DNA polymerase III subunit delta' [Gammaproteobacteria bacterium]|nr:DNA polymerase III subunit delta' [Gammaproteobacteria bacterium]
MSNIAYPPHPWQRESWEHLLHLKQSDRMPHALLLSGNDAIGKYEFAKAFAQVLLCNQPLEHSPCGECKSCLLFQSEDGHPDYMLVEPEGKLGIIKIEHIREILEKVVQTSQQGGYRIIVIKEAHAMNIASANALLKSLEEPGVRCIFMLLSDKVHLLLPTIRSRCQQISLEAKPSDVADKAELELENQWLGKIISDSDPLALAQEYAQADLVSCLRATTRLLSDAIKLRSFAALPLGYPEYRLQMTQMVAGIPLVKLYMLLDKCYRLNAEAQLKISLNQQLMLEDLLIEWNRTFFPEPI